MARAAKKPQAKTAKAKAASTDRTDTARARAKVPAPESPEAKRARYLAARSKGWSKTKAAKSAGIGRTTLYAWLDADEAFARADGEAYEEGLDDLEDIARGFAAAGSEKLIIALLQAGRPERYRHNHVVRTPDLKTDPQTVRDAILGKLARIAAAE